MRCCATGTTNGKQVPDELMRFSLHANGADRTLAAGSHRFYVRHNGFSLEGERLLLCEVSEGCLRYEARAREPEVNINVNPLSRFDRVSPSRNLCLITNAKIVSGRSRARTAERERRTREGRKGIIRSRRVKA